MAKADTRSERLRAPRVQITYDFEVGGELRRKELPFVVGVMGDFSGKPAEPLPKLRDRRFVEVHRENFDAVLRGMKPRLAFTVNNRLTEDGSRLAVDVRFERLEDFEPDSITRQIEPLRRLLETRERLSRLRSAIARNDEAGRRLRELLSRHGERLRALRTAPAAGSGESA